MKKIEVIQKSCSPYASPITIVEVLRSDGKQKIRLCNDTTELNKATIKDAGLLPNFRMIFDKLGGAVVYIIMDMVAEYWQVRVRREDIPKTAFVTVQGQYEYLRMPFGLCNTSATFQQLMNHVLHDHLDEFVMVYLDDVVIYSKSMMEHVKYLDWILGQLKQARLKIKVEKCEFAKSEIKLLGYRISAEGTTPDPGKVTAIEALE